MFNSDHAHACRALLHVHTLLNDIYGWEMKFDRGLQRCIDIIILIWVSNGLASITLFNDVIIKISLLNSYRYEVRINVFNNEHLSIEIEAKITFFDNFLLPQFNEARDHKHDE